MFRVEIFCQQKNVADGKRFFFVLLVCEYYGLARYWIIITGGNKFALWCCTPGDTSTDS